MNIAQTCAASVVIAAAWLTGVSGLAPMQDHPTKQEPKKAIAPAQPGEDDAISDKPLQVDEGKLRSYIELVRKDVRLQKSVVVAQNMNLTESEAADFWPVHREYEVELAKTTDRKIAVIERFLKAEAKLTDAEATAMANDVFDIEDARVALKRKYFEKMSKVVPAAKAARFFQIENQLNMLIDLQIAAALPMIK